VELTREQGEKGNLSQQLVQTRAELTRAQEEMANLKQRPQTPARLPGTVHKVGDIIGFGKYEWRVLKRKGNKALIITKDVIMRRRFDTKSNQWGTSEIKAYLNREFYNTAFTPEEKKVIGGSSDDKIFLLSFYEAKALFKSDEDRRAFILNYATEEAWWWLRSPDLIGSWTNLVDYVLGRDAYAAGVDAGGDVDVCGRDVSESSGSGGVRPALWIHLQS
jgi:hypothetical protein